MKQIAFIVTVLAVFCRSAEAQLSYRRLGRQDAVSALSEEQREKWKSAIAYKEMLDAVKDAENWLRQKELPEKVLATLPKDEREFYDKELRPIIENYANKKKLAEEFLEKMSSKERSDWVAFKEYYEDFEFRAEERVKNEERIRQHLESLRGGFRPNGPRLLGGSRRLGVNRFASMEGVDAAVLIERLNDFTNQLAMAKAEVAVYESIKDKAATLSPEAKKLYEEDKNRARDAVIVATAEIERLRAKLTPEIRSAYQREQERKEAEKLKADAARDEYEALLRSTGSDTIGREVRQRERERAEQRQQLLAIQEELKRVRAAKAAEARSAGVASQLAVRREVETQRPLEPNESRLNCPRFAGYALGDVITNGVCVSRYRRFDHGEWESSTASWTLNVTEPVLGFSGEAKVGTDANGVIQSVYLRENVRVDPQTEDVRAKLIELILRHQEIVLREGGFDKSLYGTNSFDSIDLHGSSAYDLHQHLGFADARAEIYGCYRKGGPWGNEMLTCELRLNAPRKCQAPSAGKAKRSYSLPKDKYAEIGTLEGYSLGEKYDLAAHDGKRRFNLNKPVFGCGRLRLGLSKKNRIWEIGFEDSGHVPAGDAYESLTEVFLRYQKEVIAHYGYPEELLGKDNTYFVEDFETKRGSSRYYITQWLSFKKGSFQITLNAYDSRKGDGIDWNMSVRAVDFKVSREDDE